jgi:hypothetical protein
MTLKWKVLAMELCVSVFRADLPFTKDTDQMPVKRKEI